MGTELLRSHTDRLGLHEGPFFGAGSHGTVQQPTGPTAQQSLGRTPEHIPSADGPRPQTATCTFFNRRRGKYVPT